MTNTNDCVQSTNQTNYNYIFFYSLMIFSLAVLSSVSKRLMRLSQTTTRAAHESSETRLTEQRVQANDSNTSVAPHTHACVCVRLFDIRCTHYGKRLPNTVGPSSHEVSFICPSHVNVEIILSKNYHKLKIYFVICFRSSNVNAQFEQAHTHTQLTTTVPNINH